MTYNFLRLKGAYILNTLYICMYVSLSGSNNGPYKKGYKYKEKEYTI